MISVLIVCIIKCSLICDWLFMYLFCMQSRGCPSTGIQFELFVAYPHDLHVNNVTYALNGFAMFRTTVFKTYQKHCRQKWLKKEFSKEIIQKFALDMINI